ncbi:MAG: cytochrome [Bdellovibrionales bacterium]|nr:cytochrome [Bdellovibrionales bacterium]
MFLQGNLQLVFDALYTVGVIDPVLNLDWNQITSSMEGDMETVYQTFRKINACSENYNLMLSEMEKMDEKSLQYLAMEVAREFCEYQDRTTIH